MLHNIPHNAAFHQGLHCLPRQKLSAEKQIYLEIITCDHSILYNRPFQIYYIKPGGRIY